VVRDFVLVIPLGALIDVEAERMRLQRALEKIDSELRGVEAKLANASFVDRAPANVVEHERSKQQDLAGRRERLQSSLADLSGMSG
jgi:valyl-tRNA synthetase